MIIIIGLEKAINVFNLNANQIAQKIGVSRQTVYDWLKGKRKIPKERIDQLTEIPEFRYVDKELFQKAMDSVDEIDIEIARSKYLSDRDSVEVEDDFYGIPVPSDPHAEDRQMLLEIKEREMEIKRVTMNLYDTDYMDGLQYSIGENYLNIVTSLNNLFEKEEVEKIKALIDTLSFLRNNEQFTEYVREYIKQHSEDNIDEHNTR
ncbi:helix-turn-helix domain-containing protein [Peribacillus sp. AS_2]|uniref:helix-turn-helix domain-containing protein n=1 Tax=Peribacillus sp. AS_2 TaxID=2996755 RepID=UPI0022A69E69|nr:YdaS family helix-turn-helix protein [Peribacillus sp. AS_2]MCZ0870911.1 YdaS family helix-turn-helix protein [Peribacillus sp. AS_2]